MKRLIRTALKKVGYEVHKDGAKLTPSDFIELFRSNSSDEITAFLKYAVQQAERSRSQLFQDLFVLHELNEKRGGYFVEFGAADGLFLSNSALLEKEFGWSGIVAEPSTKWHKALVENRKCLIDTRCVWSRSGERLEFTETPEAEYSALTQFKNKRDHVNRNRGINYTVETISLNDLLEKHRAPSRIDYLSIDTEGSEFDILNALDFNRWSFNVITVEHNNRPKQRDDIFCLLSRCGYRRTLTGVSQFDDWYLAPS